MSGVTVLGLDRGAVTGLGVWRPEGAGGAGREVVAALIDPAKPVELRGVDLPSGEISPRSGPRDLVRHCRDAGRRVPAGRARPDRTRTRRRRSGPASRGSRLVSLELVPPPRLIEGGADAGIAFRGRVRIGGRLAATSVTGSAWTGSSRRRSAPPSTSATRSRGRGRRAFVRARPPMVRRRPSSSARRSQRSRAAWGASRPGRRRGRERARRGCRRPLPRHDRPSSWAIARALGPPSTRRLPAPHGRTRSGSTCRTTGSPSFATRSRAGRCRCSR